MDEGSILSYVSSLDCETFCVFHNSMEEIKCCGRCGKDKAVSEFWVRNKILQAWCKSCHSERHKEYYQKNKQPYLDRAKERNTKARKEIREFVASLKDNPCMDCGNRYPPYVMDFDHRVSSQKRINVSAMARSQFTKEMVLEEVAKCDLVCSNCHRIRTHNRGWR